MKNKEDRDPAMGEWPDEERIDHIGQNGNDGLHYNIAREIASRLRDYNNWRRGADVQQPHPDQIGKDLDAAIKLISQVQQMNAALNNCALKFREYARTHSAKPDHAKAMANMEMAWLAESAMSESCKVDSASGSSILREERARAVEDFVDSVQRDSLRPHKKTLIALGKHYANQVRQGKK